MALSVLTPLVTNISVAKNPVAKNPAAKNTASRRGVSALLLTAILFLGMSLSGSALYAKSKLSADKNSSSRASVDARPLTASQAVALSRRTGKPIFAMAGTEQCSRCVRLKKMLKTDESLQPVLGQFITLKMTCGTPEERKWSKAFPSEGNAIPAVYVVTPQGKQLHGSIGSISSSELHTVLLTSLTTVGRYPNEQQWEKVAKTLDSVQESLDKQELVVAMRQLGPLAANLNKLGSLAEVSETGKKATKMIDQLIEQQRTALDEAVQAFAKDSDLSAALQVAQADRFCKLLPSLQSYSTDALKKAASNKSKRRLLKQAEDLDQAEVWSQQAKTKRKASSAYKRIAKRYLGSDAATLAEEKLAELSTSTAGTAEIYSWSDTTGKFSIQARLLEVKGSRVRLEKADGKVLTLPISKLDEQGQQRIKQHVAKS